MSCEKKTDSMERYIFEAEWYDKIASTLKKFLLFYYPYDNSVELFDLKTRKTFLKRSKCEDIEEKDFNVGSIVNIFSRNIKITNFSDKATKEKLLTRIIRTFGIIRGHGVNNMGEILKKITGNNIYISNIKMVELNKEIAMEAFKIDRENDFLESLISGPMVVLELLKNSEGNNRSDFINLLQEINVYSVEDEELSQKLIESFFITKKTYQNLAKITLDTESYTCCVIKPRAVQSQLIGPIIDDIQKAGFTIAAVQQFCLDAVSAEEFLEVYKGVLSDFEAMVSELQSGPCIAMKISHKDKNIDVVKEFRNLCGPMDPEIARQLRSNTLRAKYGKTKIKNAVHCSDLSDDGQLEVDYFFKILNEN